MSASETAGAESVQQTRKERIHVRAVELLAKVRELIHEGNARRITVIGDDGATPSAKWAADAGIAM